MTTTVHEIVVRRRREDQRHDFASAIDQIAGVESDILDLLHDLEEPDDGLSVAEVRKRIDRAAGPLIRSLPVLRRILDGEDAI